MTIMIKKRDVKGNQEQIIRVHNVSPKDLFFGAYLLGYYNLRVDADIWEERLLLLVVLLSTQILFLEPGINVFDTFQH